MKKYILWQDPAEFREDIRQMENKYDNSKLVEFYTECKNNNYIDFDDEYQNYKIKTIADKYGVHVTAEVFEQAKKAYEEAKYNEDRTKAIEANKAVNNIHEKWLSLDGKQKRLKQIQERMAILQGKVDDVEKIKTALVQAYYSGNKIEHESWFWKGLATELATGSRIAGSLAVADANEKNKKIDEYNQDLKVHIYESVLKDPKLSTIKQQEQIRGLSTLYEEYRTAFASYNKWFFNCIGYRNLQWSICEYDGSLRVNAVVWLKKKPEMPGNIDASLDGTCKAVLFRKSDNWIVSEVLLPLPYLGVGTSAGEDILGINLHAELNPTEINHNEYDMVLTDYNVCAIEEKKTTITRNKGDEDQSLSEYFYLQSIKQNLYTLDATTIERNISVINSMKVPESTKEELRQTLNTRLLQLKEIEATKERLALEQFNAEREARIKKEEEENQRLENKKREKKKKTAVFTVAAAMIVIVSLVFVFVVSPAINYRIAIREYNSGDYVSAYKGFEKAREYKDAEIYLGKCYPYYLKSIIEQASVGDYILFGKYEQDNKTSNGKEPIEWLVLAKEGNKLLVISKYCLDCKPYASAETKVNWETCSLRTWLNDAFYNNAFSNDEKNLIAITTVTADKNPDYSTTQGSNTLDKVFLLSVTEVNKYFKSKRACTGTTYAYAQGAFKSIDDESSIWWLRTSGWNSSHASYVNYNGVVDTRGYYTDCDDYAVRPALWLNLGS